MESRLIRDLKHALVLALIMLTFPAAGASAQTANSLVAGAWAMQFEIDKDFDLTSFQGATLSVKRHTSDGSAYRIGLDLDISVDDATIRNQLSDHSQENNSNHQFVDIVLSRLHYPSPDANIKFFYGYGPKLGYDRIHTESKSQSPATYFNETETNKNAYTIGLAGLFGVEWFATGSISFLAEYGSNLSYTWRKQTELSWRVDDETQTVTRDTERKDTGVSFGASAVKFGLSVYF